MTATTFTLWLYDRALKVYGEARRNRGVAPCVRLSFRGSGSDLGTGIQVEVAAGAIEDAAEMFEQAAAELRRLEPEVAAMTAEREARYERAR